MMITYFIFILFNLLINNVVVESDYQGWFRSQLKDEMPSGWKTEIKQMCNDDFTMKLSKLQENIDQRFEQIYKKFEDQLQGKVKGKLEEDLGKKLESTFKENFEKELEGSRGKKFETKLEENIRNKLEENLEAKLKIKLEENLGTKFEVKLENNLMNKLETKLEENLVKKLERKLEENLREKLEENLREKLEDNLGIKLEIKLEKNLGQKLEVKLEDSIRNKIETKIEDNLEKKLESKLEENLSKKLEENLEEKFDKIFVKKHKPQPEKWIWTSVEDAKSLSGQAVVAGYEPDKKPLWIVRTTYQNNLLPGKLNVEAKFAKYPFNSAERSITGRVEVLCAPPESVQWVECRDGVVPYNAIVGGKTVGGETLYIGRAKQQGSLTPGKVDPSQKVLYLGFDGKEFKHSVYEVLCLV